MLVVFGFYEAAKALGLNWRRFHAKESILQGRKRANPLPYEVSWLNLPAQLIYCFSQYN